MKTHQAQNNKNKDKNSDTKANSTNETKVKTAIKKENTNDSNTVSDVTDLKLNTSTAWRRNILTSSFFIERVCR